jgi:ribosomal protein S18 acetylase RimI-like enzyme
MAERLHDYDDKSLVRAIEGSLHDIARLYGHLPEAYMRDDEEILMLESGVPAYGFNAVTRTNFRKDIHNKILDTIAFFRKRKMPLMWWITPSTNPRDMPERLGRLGFLCDEACPGMFLPVGFIKDDAGGDIPGLEIKLADTREKLKDWVKIIAYTHNLGYEVIGKFIKAELEVGISPESDFLRYVGYLHGEPICTSAALFSSGVAGLYYIATLKEHRCKGFGRAVTIAPLLEAKKREYKIAVLQSTKSGLNLYKRIGFREKCLFFQYILPEKTSP